MSYENYRPSRFRLLPEVVKNLLIINGIMFFAAMYVFPQALGIDLAKAFGLHYIGSEQFRWYQFITHLFMHGSWAHILSNMFALWMFGNVLENYWGGKRFLTFYFITGLGAAFIHSVILIYDMSVMRQEVAAYMQYPSVDSFLRLFSENGNPFAYNADFQNFMGAWIIQPANMQLIDESRYWAQALMQFKVNVPTVGASGAVFGVLLAYGMLFPNTYIYLYFAIPVKAKYFVIFYGLMELYFGIQSNPGDNVAHFAHLGGMLFGFILIKFWNRRNRDYFY
jgi:membrane associated rhomboid family serine protease